MIDYRHHQLRPDKREATGARPWEERYARVYTKRGEPSTSRATPFTSFRHWSRTAVQLRVRCSTILSYTARTSYGTPKSSHATSSTRRAAFTETSYMLLHMSAYVYFFRSGFFSALIAITTVRYTPRKENYSQMLQAHATGEAAVIGSSSLRVTSLRVILRADGI